MTRINLKTALKATAPLELTVRRSDKLHFMKPQAPKPVTELPALKRRGRFASKAEFLAAEQRRFQEVFGKVDWEKARRDGLIR